MPNANKSSITFLFHLCTTYRYLTAKTKTVDRLQLHLYFFVIFGAIYTGARAGVERRVLSYGWQHLERCLLHKLTPGG